MTTEEILSALQFIHKFFDNPTIWEGESEHTYLRLNRGSVLHALILTVLPAAIKLLTAVSPPQDDERPVYGFHLNNRVTEIEQALRRVDGRLGTIESYMGQYEVER